MVEPTVALERKSALLEGSYMDKQPRTFIRMLKLGLLLTIGVSMVANAGIFSRSKTWKEEVLLHDGKVLVVTRHSNPADYLIPGSREPQAADESLEFTLPGTSQRIVWKTEYRNEAPEPNALGPLLLDIVDGVPYLATSPAGCIAYNKWGRPNPPYILFKYEHEKWERISLQEFPPQLVKANLMGIPPRELLKSYYKVEQAQAWAQGLNIAEYARTILREPLLKEQINEMCMEMILYKGYWVMPNDPVARRMIDNKSK